MAAYTSVQVQVQYARHRNHTSDEAEISPLLKRYGVQAYMGGHVHNLQEVEVDGIRFITGDHPSRSGATW